MPLLPSSTYHATPPLSHCLSPPRYSFLPPLTMSPLCYRVASVQRSRWAPSRTSCRRTSCRLLLLSSGRHLLPCSLPLRSSSGHVSPLALGQLHCSSFWPCHIDASSKGRAEDNTTIDLSLGMGLMKLPYLRMGLLNGACLTPSPLPFPKIEAGDVRQSPSSSRKVMCH